MAVEPLPGVLDGILTSAKHWRLMLQAVAGGAVGSFAGGVGATNGQAHGVASATAFAVTQSDSPAMSVKVAPGAALITGTVAVDQGVYGGRNNTATTLVIAPAEASIRRDLIIAQPRDAAFSGTDRDFRLVVVTGVAGSGSDPSLALYPNALVLARVTVPVSPTSAITNSMITDLRTYAGTYDLKRRFGEWTSYVPVLSGAGWTLGGAGAQAFGAWTEVYGTVFFNARLIFGATPGVTAAVPQVSLPVPAESGFFNTANRSSIRADLRDTSAGLQYEGWGEVNGSIVSLGCHTASTTFLHHSYVVNTQPFPWAATDEIRLAGWYRKA